MKMMVDCEKGLMMGQRKVNKMLLDWGEVLVQAKVNAMTVLMALMLGYD